MSAPTDITVGAHFNNRIWAQTLSRAMRLLFANAAGDDLGIGELLHPSATAVAAGSPHAEQRGAEGILEISSVYSRASQPSGRLSRAACGI